MTAKIIVENSYSRVVDIDNDTLSFLRKELSYKDDPSKAFYSPYGPKTYYLIDKRGVFLTGLLERVQDLLSSYGILDKRVRPLVNFKSPTAPGVSLYPAQEEAIKRAQTHHQGIISMPTGSGKSIAIGALIRQFNLKTLIVVPNLELKKQLQETVNRFSHKNQVVDVYNIDSTALQTTKSKYDLLIVDEAHHSAAKTYQKLNKGLWSNIYYRYYFTATPFRNQKSEQLLFEGMTGSLIYNLTYKDAINSKYIVPVEAYSIKCDKIPNEFRAWPQVYSGLVVNNDVRNLQISSILKDLIKNKKSVLCLVKEIKHGEILSELTDVPFANGQDDESRPLIKDFAEGRIRGLIGTSGIIGEGVDTKSCEYVIIAGLGKAKSAFMQQVGRAVRKYPGKESAKVIIFNDSSHKFTKSHFGVQKKILLDEFGVVPVTLEL